MAFRSPSRSRLSISLALTVMLLLSAPLAAAAFSADFFEKDASGNASYEAMVIHPEAVYHKDSHTTYMAYQGPDLDPYLIAYRHATKTWEGPFKVNDNPLTTDAHGGPALLVDKDGYVHVFYGAHGESLWHSVSVSRGEDDISTWASGNIRIQLPQPGSTNAAKGTYPQPLLADDGGIVLLWRSSNGSSDKSFPNEDSLYNAWASTEATPGAIRNLASTWTTATPVLQSENYLSYKAAKRFYANFSMGTNDVIRAAFSYQLYTGAEDALERKNVYYMYRGEDRVWRNSRDDTVTVVPSNPGEAMPCLVDETDDDPDLSVNNLVVREMADGTPAILYLREMADVPQGYEWVFAKPGEPEWSKRTIAETDDFFDAGDFAPVEEGSDDLEAYLVTGGVPDDQAIVGSGEYAARGGDIVRVTSGDDGVNWDETGTVVRSSDASERYNDPQVVRGIAPGDSFGTGIRPRVMFSEWNNDVANFIHKVFLWGTKSDGMTPGYIQKTFTPEVERFAGATRVDTAVEVSRNNFPQGAGTVFVASMWDFPDVLCGAPLAHSYDAPILLVDTHKLHSQVAAEVTRLMNGNRTRNVFILGGESVVGPDLQSALTAAAKAAPASGSVSTKVTRIAGDNRYETASAVASALEARRGMPEKAVVACGEDFADALSASPLAARMGYPILLSKRASLPEITAKRLVALGRPGVLMIGGQVALSTAVENALAVPAPGPAGAPLRLWGPNRYATGSTVADYATDLDAWPSGTPTAWAPLSLERFVLASGENFPDAVVGGVLAARVRGPLVLTRASGLPSETSALLGAKALNVLDAYVLGGEKAVTAGTEGSLAGLLMTLQGP